MKASEAVQTASNKKFEVVDQAIHQAAKDGKFTVFLSEGKEVVGVLRQKDFGVHITNSGFHVDWHPEVVRRNRIWRWVKIIFTAVAVSTGAMLLFLGAVALMIAIDAPESLLNLITLWVILVFAVGSVKAM